MKHLNSKQTTLASILIFACLGLLAGMLLILIPTNFLINVIFVVMGVLTILYNIPGFAAGLVAIHTKMGIVTVLLSLISIVTGFLMIFWHADLLMIFLGAYMVIFPLVEILLSEDKSQRLKTELPKIIIGLVLLLVGPSTVMNVMFDVAGWIVIGLTALYVVVILIAQIRGAGKAKQQTGGRIFVDTTGDGKIDTVYHDTNGDGTPDTATEYRENK
ncbi:MAG: hypothetical protein E7666_00835 [Ruminococcaceae bacterium]|nr:hypothetical protein [Oscillospiraceae bacterium]